MRGVKAAGVYPGPHFVLEETTGGQCLVPKALGWDAILGQEMGEDDGGVEIDHRSARSWSSSSRRSRSLVTGRRAGSSARDRTGGVTHPRRTASARRASASSPLRPPRGGPSSATTRSRSVTSTVSPVCARRMYSLSLFFRTLRPTARMSPRSLLVATLSKPRDATKDEEPMKITGIETFVVSNGFTPPRPWHFCAIRTDAG